MKSKINLEWLYAAGLRAIRTVAQTALGMITVGAAMNEIRWEYVISISVVAGIYSILTSVATNLPEVGTDGTLQIDTSAPNKDTYLLALDNEVESLSTKKTVKLTVNSNADLSQK